MGAATYRIGPSDVFSPGDLSADADTVDGQVKALDGELAGNEHAPVDFVDQWTAWENQWRAFYTAHFGGFFTNFFSALNDSNRDDLIRYENQLATFIDQARAFDANVIAPVGPSSGAKDNLGDQLAAQGLHLPSISTLVVLVVAVIVAVVVWKS
jgi:hypothetical protein